MFNFDDSKAWAELQRIVTEMRGSDFRDPAYWATRLDTALGHFRIVVEKET